MVLDRAATDLSKLLPALDARTAKIAQRVQQAMRNQSIGPHHFAGSTGYGHGDLGREAFDAVRAAASCYYVTLLADFCIAALRATAP